MMRTALFIAAIFAGLLLWRQPVGAQGRVNGNPVFPGWYADPEAAIFGNRYWIYPTYSAKYNEQVFFDAFSSDNLITWTKHSRILDTA